MSLEKSMYVIRLRVRSLFRSSQIELEEAGRSALLGLRGVERTKEECRDARRVSWIQDLVGDLRYVYVAKTSYTCRMNDLARDWQGHLDSH